MDLADFNARVLTPAPTDRACDSRSANGTPLYLSPCPDCGVERLNDKRWVGSLCRACSGVRRAKHGLSAHPLYRLLKNIESRCNYPSATHYEYYGGRGIKVCREWSENPASFVQWAESAGWQKGLEIDRIDNDGDYSPENCQCISHLENMRKRADVKCTPEKAEAIAKAINAGASVGSAANDAGVPYMVAWHIKSGKTWRKAA